MCYGIGNDIVHNREHFFSSSVVWCNDFVSIRKSIVLRIYNNSSGRLLVEYRFKYCHTYEIDSLVCRFTATFQAVINGLSECLSFDSLIKLGLTIEIGHEEELHLATKSPLKKAKSSQNNGIRWSNTYDALTLIEIISISMNIGIACGMSYACQQDKGAVFNVRSMQNKKMYNHHDDCDCLCDVLAFWFYFISFFFFVHKTNLISFCVCQNWTAQNIRMSFGFSTCIDHRWKKRAQKSAHTQTNRNVAATNIPMHEKHSIQIYFKQKPKLID